MQKPSRKLQAQWDRKLAASGFHDLEVGNGDTLSNRGTMSRPTDDEAQRLAQEREYYDQAQAILRTFPFASKRDRTIWRLHANHMGLHPIAAKLRIPYQQIRAAQARILATARAWMQTRQQEHASECRPTAIKRVSPVVLGPLAALFLRSLRPRT